MTKKYLSSAILILVLTAAASLASAAGPFHKDIPINPAVPNFIDAVMEGTATVKDPDELNAINEWAQDGRESLPEFLDDLLIIAQQLEAQGTPEFIFDKYNAFAEKWGTLAETYPGLNELDPIISPLIDQLFAGLPTLQPPSSDNPLSGLADLYRALDQETPWGIRRLFRLEPVTSHKVVTIKEVLEEQKKAGVISKSIVYRETLARVNNLVVFFERIINDQNVQFFAEFRDPTLIHEIIPLMIEEDEDPNVIAALQELADLIDLHLETAVTDGVLDPCSHGYLYRKNFGNALQNCVDVTGEVRDAPKMFRYNPWDDVNQVKLTDVETISDDELEHIGTESAGTPVDVQPLTAETEVAPMLEQYQQGFKAPAQTYLIGILFPAYLLSVIGFFKGI